VFGLVVLHCDEYFSVVDVKDLERSSICHLNFFEIMKDLPIELQMRICHVALGIDKVFFSPKHSDQALRKILLARI